MILIAQNILKMKATINLEKMKNETYMKINFCKKEKEKKKK